MVIELRGAARRWGDRVGLRALNLTIEAGERVALLGPSGSGKTTLLRLIAGSLRATGGSVIVDGSDLDTIGDRALRRHRQRCGILAQGGHAIDGLTVHANVASGLLPKWPWYRVLGSLLWATDKSRIEKLLTELGVGDRQWDPAAELSGGQLQRVAVARAIIGSPELLLLDEPTSALDPETASSVLSTINSNRTPDQTVVISTHRATEALAHVDRVLGLREGALELDLSPSALTEDHLESLYAGSRELI